MNGKKKRTVSKTAVAPKKSNSSDVLGEATFHFVISPHYRVIRVSGALGGVTPQNDVVVTLYNERYPIPESVTHDVSQTGLVSEPKREVVKKGMTREVEAVLSLNPEIAKSLGIWLLKQAEVAEGYQQEINRIKASQINKEV